MAMLSRTSRRANFSLNRFLAPSGGGIDFSQIQIKLRLVPLHANRGIAQAFRLAPF
jgi:hypothetical protein